MSSNGGPDSNSPPLGKAAGGADLAALREHLERRGERLAEAAIWYIGHRIAGALAHAHAVTDDEGNPAPAVHLGLRPDDVMIAWDGRVRMINRARKSAGFMPSAAALRFDETDSEYMAPEQREGARVTHRTDVYRLGLLLWSLLLWQRPPSDGSRPAPLAAARADLPRAITDALDAALEPAASRRRITCLELEQWLATIVDASAGERALREHLATLTSPHAKTIGTKAFENASSPADPTETADQAQTSTENEPAIPTEPVTQAEAETQTEAEPQAETQAESETETQAEAETETPTETSPGALEPPATALRPAALDRPSPAKGPLSTAGFVSVALVFGALVVIIGALVGDRLLDLAAPNHPESSDFRPKE